MGWSPDSPQKGNAEKVSSQKMPLSRLIIQVPQKWFLRCETIFIRHDSFCTQTCSANYLG